LAPQLIPWHVLFSRLVHCAVAQALIDAALALTGAPEAWDESGRWWVFGVIVANAVTILVLVRLLHAEGRRHLDILRFERRTFWGDPAARPEPGGSPAPSPCWRPTIP
jgi:hypothetical protein